MKFIKQLILTNDLKKKLDNHNVTFFQEKNLFEIDFLTKNHLSPREFKYVLIAMNSFNSSQLKQNNHIVIPLTSIYFKNHLNYQKPILKDYEIYPYVTTLLNLINPQIKPSSFYVKTYNEKTNLIFLDDPSLINGIEEEIELLETYLKNFSILNFPLQYEYDNEPKSNILNDFEEQNSKAKKLMSSQSPKTKLPRSGYKMLNPSLQESKEDVYFEGEIMTISAREITTKRNRSMLIWTLLVGLNGKAVEVIYWSNDDQKLQLTENSLIRIYGNWEFDSWKKYFTFKVNSENDFEAIFEKEVDLSNNIFERGELHVHTKMSTMDGVGRVSKYIERAEALNIKSLAFVDHDSIQSYPKIALEDKILKSKKSDLKLIYGVEFSIFDDSEIPIVINEKDQNLYESELIFFDLETTGLYPLTNKIIEFGAVKWKNGSIIDEKQFFINPGSPIPQYITEITNIKDSDVKDGKTLEDAMKEVKDWIGDSTLVAHNAKFDYRFLDSSFRKCGLGKLENTVIDTLGISRLLNPNYKNHKLETICEKQGVKYNSHVAHRADYDAKVLHEVFENFLQDLADKDMDNVLDLNKNKETLSSFIFPNHIVVLVKNQKGMKDLFNLISLSHTKTLNKKRKQPILHLSNLLQNRKNLLVGSACSEGLLWNAIVNDTDNIEEVIKYYDYIEIFPPSVYANLIERNFFTKEEIIEILKLHVKLANDFDIPVIISSNAHYVNKEDKWMRDIYIANKGIGGKRHPLFNFRNPTMKSPDQHLRNSKEIFDEFKPFFSEELIEKLASKNTLLISKKISKNISPLKDKLYTPKIPNSRKEFLSIIDKNLEKIYGKKPNKIISDRIKRELKSITDHGYDVIYYLSSLAVRKSISDGYIVGSRGSVGSSLAATLSEITDVNPLPPHYICPKCKYHKFSQLASSGYDLPKMKCPECKHELIGEGHDIPFETFLGINADKVPDIDLNFSREHQSTIHEYIKEVIGKDNVYRAGTIQTVAKRTAHGFIINYNEMQQNQNNELDRPSKEYQALKIEGTKRGTSQHPGGLIVIPNDMDIHDFTPINFPGNDSTKRWTTTHLDFHSLHDNVLKLDFLGHLDPSLIKMLADLTGINPIGIPLGDKDVISLFSKIDALNLKSNHLNLNVGTLGIPEFGTDFVINLLEDAQPKSFADLIRVSGLSHGTNVWAKNARDLIINENKHLNEVISTRDDILNYLSQKGIELKLAFDIMESVRKGKGLTTEWEEEMKSHKVPDWYINSCKKIKYMFPKAHATAYVIMAYRIGWFKVHHPLEYYATFFTKRDTEFDFISISGSIDEVLKYYNSLLKLGWKKTDTEQKIVDTYKSVIELLDRGYKISKLSLNESLATEWKVDKKNNCLIPPFNIITSLGEAAATKIINERNKKSYQSLEDFINRSGTNKTLIKTMKENGILDILDKGTSSNSSRNIFNHLK